jgi:hypothetical protein
MTLGRLGTPPRTFEADQDFSDTIGLPRLQFLFVPIARFWHEYHYNAIREFFEAKGFDPYSNEVTRLLGLSLAEMESNNPASKYPEFYGPANGGIV